MRNKILIMDSGSYKTFGGSVRDAYNIYSYLKGFGRYEISMLGDFSKLDKKLKSLMPDDVFSEKYASSSSDTSTDYRLVLGSFFRNSDGLLNDTFLSRKYDVILSGSRKDILIIDPYLLKNPGTKVIYVDRANILVNYSNAGLRRLTPTLIGTRRILDVMRKWLDIYVSMTIEQFSAAQRFFHSNTKITYIKTAPHAQYRKLHIKQSFSGGIYVGRLEEKQKRIRFLISGIAEVLHLHPELKDKELLRIIGEGPHEEYYRELVARLGLSANIRFMGPKFGYDLVEAYNNCGFFVSTSIWESPGRTFLEAMACGTPLLINERVNKLMSVNPNVYMVKDGYNGSIYKYGNNADFAVRFYKMYSDSARTKRMAANAHVFVRKEFSVNRTVGQFKREIDALLGQSKPRRSVTHTVPSR